MSTHAAGATPVQAPPNLAVFGDHEQRVIDQAARCLQVEGARGALMPDGHLGYSAPIGAVLAYPEHVSPSGVGYDIGCGNKAVLTDVRWSDLEPSIGRVMDRIAGEVSFGVGRSRAAGPVDHPVLDAIRTAAFAPQRKLYDLAARQLGTVGAGNHYVDLFRDQIDRVWVGVHFGSRGFGHKTASGFLALAAADGLVPVKGRARRAGQTVEQVFMSRGPEGEMESPPTLLRASSPLGESYIEAMRLAGEYAYAGRDVVVRQVLDILGARAVEEVHNHHNYAWRESHGGQEYWVVRKGATPARPGQKGFVGATMGETSVILEGVHAPIPSLQEYALYSTIHGAGRAMSRTQAAGKRRKRWTCNNRDCNYVQGDGEPSPMTQEREGGRLTGRCPHCGHTRLTKRWVQSAGGAIDWLAVRAELAAQGIVLRGGAADEAPGAYKRLTEVLEPIADTVSVLHWLEPVGVAMAGPEIDDPYKD